nr:MAG TPA: hypothetical protein [Siphoviridae sp. ctekg1]DAP17796.1 MAG TPA: hypothetical protein [Caudoviricetes sp.]
MLAIMERAFLSSSDNGFLGMLFSPPFLLIISN